MDIVEMRIAHSVKGHVKQVHTVDTSELNLDSILTTFFDENIYVRPVYGYIQPNTDSPGEVLMAFQPEENTLQGSKKTKKELGSLVTPPGGTISEPYLTLAQEKKCTWEQAYILSGFLGEADEAGGNLEAFINILNRAPGIKGQNHLELRETTTGHDLYVQGQFARTYRRNSDNTIIQTVPEKPKELFACCTPLNTLKVGCFVGLDPADTIMNTRTGQLQQVAVVVLNSIIPCSTNELATLEPANEVKELQSFHARRFGPDFPTVPSTAAALAGIMGDPRAYHHLTGETQPPGMPHFTELPLFEGAKEANVTILESLDNFRYHYGRPA